ncbi:response regulator transcription factor [Vogesella sp. LIG4]|uniref:response regulator transcription factor n=1 Tax=Vogesella sp. LIG4 TaxID=1192162 RepID=UPI00081FF1AC|nr:response regulator transcription factor [Vogesella sp. LIG4]SCK26470.1 DNA-binding response regulator, NarL/FixJ family, contains REC and HTH domains [Vogesella sp. LIG4]
MIHSFHPRIRVVILDDHAIVRQGLATHLGQESDLEVVASFASGRELVAALKSKSLVADVLVIDYSLGPAEIDGINLIKLLRTRYPGVKILVLSASHNKATVNMVMHAGAQGFVGKDEEVPELVRAIRSVANGRKRIKEELFTETGHRLPQAADAPPDEDAADDESPLLNRQELSPREYEVLRCYLDGMSVTEIAEKFMRSVKTISTQKQSAYRKLGIHTDAELFKIRQQLENG